MKHFDSDTFLDIARTLKLDEHQRAFLPEFRIVLIKAIWEGRAEESLLQQFDEIIAY
ncbi:MAG: hypothetical protein IKB70_12200 [Bacilli bacterium]|nr:hypothetical protein [Bacilli bacterium]